jgi:hypothetical protein
MQFVDHEQIAAMKSAAEIGGRIAFDRVFKAAEQVGASRVDDVLQAQSLAPLRRQSEDDAALAYSSRAAQHQRVVRNRVRECRFREGPDAHVLRPGEEAPIFDLRTARRAQRRLWRVCQRGERERKEAAYQGKSVRATGVRETREKCAKRKPSS